VNQRFCPECGAPRNSTARFCGGCGKTFDAAKAEAPSETPPAAATPAVASQPVPLTPTALPPLNIMPGSWNVVVGDVLPPILAAIPTNGIPGVMSTVPMAIVANSASLRGSAWSVAITTATDIAAAYGTGDPAALNNAYLRGGLALFSLIAGLLAGSSRGWMSRLTIVGTLALALVQSGSLYGFAMRILQNPQMLSGLVPNALTQGLSLVAAVRTAWLARR